MEVLSQVFKQSGLGVFAASLNYCIITVMHHASPTNVIYIYMGGIFGIFGEGQKGERQVWKQPGFWTGNAHMQM